MTWEITDHVCRVCLGRILSRQQSEGGCVRCADCGLERTGRTPSLCACGTKLRSGKNAGFRCAPNPEVTPEMPVQIVVVHEG